jgi:hypothetical protein
MKRILLLLIGLSAGCGGNPVAPPPPPPPPQFIGDWFGFLDISYAFPLTGETTHDLCDHQWTVQSQTGTAFTGAFRSNGGTAEFPIREGCLDSGMFSGFVSSDARITGLTFTPVLLGGISVNRECSVISRATFTGTTEGLSISAQGMDAIVCPAFGSLARINRSLLLRLFKRNP